MIKKNYICIKIKNHGYTNDFIFASIFFSWLWNRIHY